MRSSSAAMLLVAMMFCGCATVSETTRDVARAQKASSAKHASTTKAEPPQPSCPPIDKETYQAISEAPPGPPDGYNWKPQQTRQWVESLEKQNAKLKERLGEEVIARSKCR